jgi:hypothetical protein
LIELPTFKFTDLEKITDAGEKHKLLIERNYSEVKDLKPFNGHQYRLSEISISDLKKAIDLHISDLPINDSCAFFGGYALKVNDDYVLFPQCCGLLSEINDWKKILSKEFKPFYLTECHPSPRFQKIEDDIVIECNSSNEEFYPKTNENIIIKHEPLIFAIEKVCIELTELSKKLDNFNAVYKTESVARNLIWNQ